MTNENKASDSFEFVAFHILTKLGWQQEGEYYTLGGGDFCTVSDALRQEAQRLLDLAKALEKPKGNVFIPQEDKQESIEFTQFLLPNGRREQVRIPVDKEIYGLASQLTTKGYRFEIEVLRTGHVSMEVCRETEEGEAEVLANEIVPNGPEIPEAVNRMIRSATTALKSKALQMQ